MKFHWWVTFMMTKDGQTAYGAMHIWTSSKWFPLQASQNLIRQMKGGDQVMIQGWQSISEDQVSELYAETMTTTEVDKSETKNSQGPVGVLQ